MYACRLVLPLLCISCYFKVLLKVLKNLSTQYKNFIRARIRSLVCHVDVTENEQRKEMILFVFLMYDDCDVMNVLKNLKKKLIQIGSQLFMNMLSYCFINGFNILTAKVLLISIELIVVPFLNEQLFSKRLCAHVHSMFDDVMFLAITFRPLTHQKSTHVIFTNI